MKKAELKLETKNLSTPSKAGRGRPRKLGREPVGIQSVEIAIEIVSELVRHEEGMNLMELSGLTGLQPSKLHRYLVSFTRHGLFRQSSVSGKYDFGPLARRIGAAAFNRHHGMALVHELITNICIETGCTVYLYIWTELGPTLVRTEMGRSPRALSLREGTALPLCSSATGRTFLAYLPENFTNDLLSSELSNSAINSHSKWNKQTLNEELAKIRDEKIFWTNETILPGPLAIVPLFDSTAELNSVLAVLPRSDISHDEKKKLKKLLEAKSHQLLSSLV